MILKKFTALETAKLNIKSWSKNTDVALISSCQIFLTAGAECNIGYGGGTQKVVKKYKIVWLGNLENKEYQYCQHR